MADQPLGILRLGASRCNQTHDAQQQLDYVGHTFCPSNRRSPLDFAPPITLGREAF